MSLENKHPGTLGLSPFSSGTTRVVHSVAVPLAPDSAAPRVTVVLPAYNAARTLERTYRDIPKELADDIILVDDASHDDTVECARELGIHVVAHLENRGYGANQKTCYRIALERGAAVVVMVHPDYQYDPKVLPDLVRPILENRADVVFGSRLLTPGGARGGGMPLYKYAGNRVLTWIENRVFSRQLSEYHTGLRAYSRRFLEAIDFQANSDGFAFDSQVVGQIMCGGYRLDEIPVETRYFREASSVGLSTSIRYGFGTLAVCGEVALARLRGRMPDPPP